MCPLFISTPFNVFYRLKSKILKNIETNQIGISSTGHEKKIFLFSLKSLDKNFNKTSKYLKSLPECLCKDSKTPDIFSFSWLQRIGKVKIYLPENVFKNDKNYLKSYSKFFFSLEKKKKKKKTKS